MYTARVVFTKIHKNMSLPIATQTYVYFHYYSIDASYLGTMQSPNGCFGNAGDFITNLTHIQFLFVVYVCVCFYRVK